MKLFDTARPQAAAPLQQVVDQVAQVVLGKEQQIRLALCCLLARGHLLIDDLPGLGKTTLAHVLARTLGLEFKRIQFTSDMLPADILGVSVFHADRQAFQFHPGPIFAQCVLADEINRATPKAQSALLEAMQEGQVSYDGRAYRLPEPFFVIATQNPDDQIGTFPLPESQLDRFLMRIHMGYPDHRAERALLTGRDRRALAGELAPLMDGAELAAWQRQVDEVYCSEPLLDYAQDLLAASRRSALFAHGLSPRAGLALLRATRAWALLHGRDRALPDDVQAVMSPVFGHRLRPSADAGPVASALTKLRESVPVR